MNSEKYTVEPRVRADHYDDVVKVEQGDLPDGIDAVFLVRSTLSRQQLHAALVHLQDHIYTKTWPPSDPNGGDREGERLLNLSHGLFNEAAALESAGKKDEAKVKKAEAELMRARSGL